MRKESSPIESYFLSLTQAQLPVGFEIFRDEAAKIQKSGMSLAPLEAGILSSLVALHGGEKWIEIGTLTGFSGFCLSRSLPSHGRLWTFEKDPALAQKARQLFNDQGLIEKVKVIEGDAQQTLPTIEPEGPFDGIFIDGNKGAYVAYLDWAEQNLKPDALIIADNVFLGGALWEGTGSTQWSSSVIERMKDFVQRLFDPNRYQTCLIPTGEGLLVAKRKF